jgi:elongation factor Ts
MLDKVKELRAKTFLSISDCMKAVEAVTKDNKEYSEVAAIEWLQQNGVLKAAKLENRDMRAGIIYAYIHHDKSIGVLLKLTCETDFVSKNEKFTELAKNLCMHIVASSPTYISIDKIEQRLLNLTKLWLQK